MDNLIQYQVVVSNRAARQLSAHVGFLAKVSVPAAQQFHTDFQKAAASLSTMPQRNPTLRYEGIAKEKYRKLSFAGRYLLLYQIIATRVHIEYVVDCRQDYQWLIK